MFQPTCIEHLSVPIMYSWKRELDRSSLSTVSIGLQSMRINYIAKSVIFNGPLILVARVGEQSSATNVQIGKKSVNSIYSYSREATAEWICSFCHSVCPTVFLIGAEGIQQWRNPAEWSYPIRSSTHIDRQAKMDWSVSNQKCWVRGLALHILMLCSVAKSYLTFAIAS